MIERGKCRLHTRSSLSEGRCKHKSVSKSTGENNEWFNCKENEKISSEVDCCLSQRNANDKRRGDPRRNHANGTRPLVRINQFHRNS